MEQLAYSFFESICNKNQALLNKNKYFILTLDERDKPHVDNVLTILNNIPKNNYTISDQDGVCNIINTNNNMNKNENIKNYWLDKRQEDANSLNNIVIRADIVKIVSYAKYTIMYDSLLYKKHEMWTGAISKKFLLQHLRNSRWFAQTENYQEAAASKFFKVLTQKGLIDITSIIYDLLVERDRLTTRALNILLSYQHQEHPNHMGRAQTWQEALQRAAFDKRFSLFDMILLTSFNEQIASSIGYDAIKSMCTVDVDNAMERIDVKYLLYDSIRSCKKNLCWWPENLDIHREKANLKLESQIVQVMNDKRLRMRPNRFYIKESTHDKGYVIIRSQDKLEKKLHCAVEMSVMRSDHQQDNMEKSITIKDAHIVSINYYSGNHISEVSKNYKKINAILNIGQQSYQDSSDKIIIDQK